MRVLFRAEAGPEIGLGHVMRCLALAGALKAMGAGVGFLGRGYAPALQDKLRERGCASMTLSPDEAEPEATCRRARTFAANVVVVDLYGIAETYLRSLRDTGIVLVSLDDRNLMPFPSHLVVNPNRFALDMLYHSSTGDTQFLLGPTYFLLREEFLKACGALREIAPCARNLLISMGGSDPGGLAEKVVRAVAPLGLEIVVIRGSASGDAFAAAWPNIRVIADPPNMAEWMLWADLAVTSGGGTIYELAATGTPGIILAQVADQERNAAAMETEGALASLGMGAGVSEDTIVSAVQALAGDAARRQAMSRRGRELVDGKGAQRVAAAVQALVQSRRQKGRWG